jgi:hypothetical protein
MVAEKEFKLQYPIAKNHQIIQFSPIFRPIKRGARRKGVEKIYISKDGKTTAKIKMFKELDIADQDLLLAIIAIALPIERGIVLNEQSNEIFKILLKKLKIQNNDNHNINLIQTIMIETTSHELLKELGKQSGKSSYEWLKNSLERLSDTNLYLESKDFIGNTNLISYFFDKTTKKIYIALNPINALGDIPKKLCLNAKIIAKNHRIFS